MTLKKFRGQSEQNRKSLASRIASRDKRQDQFDSDVKMFPSHSTIQQRIRSLSDNSSMSKRHQSFLCMAAKDKPSYTMQLLEKGNLKNFKTASMSTNVSALRHVFSWESSTGKLEDLSHIQTREKVSWNKPPDEFGGVGDYSSDGEHNGLTITEGKSGKGTDNHDIYPAQGFPKASSYRLDSDGTSSRWTLRQVYQMNINGDGWIPIPGSDYVLKRWFERKGFDLTAYIEKRGDKSHVASMDMKNWYKPSK